MEISPLDSVLAQLRAAQAATQAGVVVPTPALPVEQNAQAGEFSEVLKDAINSVNDVQMKAAELSKAYVSGESETSLQDVMVQMAKANISFQTMIQVRNRVVSAYQDVMNMPV